MILNDDTTMIVNYFFVKNLIIYTYIHICCHIGTTAPPIELQVKSADLQMSLCVLFMVLFFFRDCWS